MREGKRQIENQKKYYDRHYRIYFSDYRLENWRRSFISRIFENLGIAIGSSEGSFLDVGVGGTGYTVIEAAKLGQHSVGTDLSFEAVKKARNFALEQGLGKLAHFVVSSAEDLPFKSGVFSKVSIISVLEHIHRDQRAISELSRVMQRSGRLFLIVPNAYRDFYPFLWLPYFIIDKITGHCRHYSKEFLIKRFGEGFFCVRRVFYTGHLIKIFQFIISKIFGENVFGGKLWWYCECRDLRNSGNKGGLQLNALFEKE
jgi:ubiquinone/menaquinone biosynthesis C-methylase UbiE